MLVESMIACAETLPSRVAGPGIIQRLQQGDLKWELEADRDAGSRPHHGNGSASGLAQNTKSSFAVAILGKPPRPCGSLALPVLKALS